LVGIYSKILGKRNSSKNMLKMNNLVQNSFLYKISIFFYVFAHKRWTKEIIQEELSAYEKGFPCYMRYKKSANTYTADKKRPSKSLWKILGNVHSKNVQKLQIIKPHITGVAYIVFCVDQGSISSTFYIQLLRS